MPEYRVPIGEWLERLLSYLQSNWEPFFNAIRVPIAAIEQGLRSALLEPHVYMLAIMAALLAWAFVGRRVALAVLGVGLLIWIGGRVAWMWDLFFAPNWAADIAPLALGLFLVLLTLRLVGWGTALFALVALALVASLELWEPMVQTLSLTLTAALVALAIGIPLGILSAKSRALRTVVGPILDFMQTMPAYVYLLPAITFFGIGSVSAVIGTIIFAMPAPVRLTYLGLRQVPEELIEAAEAFGSTPLQRLFKVELPAAIPSIMAGVNQCLMLSLSMVVIASLIGAEGLGTEVLRGLQRFLIGRGFEAGLGIVILAIILDRLLQGSLRTWQQSKRKARAS